MFQSFAVFSRTRRAGGRAVDLGGPSGYQEEPKFEIKHKSRCFQKSKLVDWGAKHVNCGGKAPLGAGPEDPYKTCRQR